MKKDFIVNLNKALVLLFVMAIIFSGCQKIEREDNILDIKSVDISQVDNNYQIKEELSGFFFNNKHTDTHAGIVNEELISPVIHCTREIDKDKFIVLCSPNKDEQSIWLFKIEKSGRPWSVSVIGSHYRSEFNELLENDFSLYKDGRIFKVCAGIFPDDNNHKGSLFIDSYDILGMEDMSVQNTRYISKTEVLSGDTGFITLLPNETDYVGDIYCRNWFIKKSIYEKLTEKSIQTSEEFFESLYLMKGILFDKVSYRSHNIFLTGNINDYKILDENIVINGSKAYVFESKNKTRYLVFYESKFIICKGTGIKRKYSIVDCNKEDNVQELAVSEVINDNQSITTLLGFINQKRIEVVVVIPNFYDEIVFADENKIYTSIEIGGKQLNFRYTIGTNTDPNGIDYYSTSGGQIK